MERTKKARIPERASIIKITTALETQMTNSPINRIEIDVLLESLTTHYAKLVELDDRIKEYLLDDEELSAESLTTEYEAMDKYYDKVSTIRAKIRILLPEPRSLLSISHAGDRSSPLTQKRRAFRLPKIELRKFSGELVEWLGWWAQFSKIHEDENLHDSDKFTYLVQCMIEKSQAFELVSSYPQSSENYPKVVKALKERFGNPKILKQVYVRELIQMISLNQKKEKTSLSQLYDKLESQLRSLESLGVSVKQMVIFLFPMVESCLPEEVLVAWQRSQFFGKVGTSETPEMNEIDFLMKFLKQEIEHEEQRKLAKETFISTWEKRKPLKRREVNDPENDLPTAAGLFNSTSQKSICIFCDRNHDSKDCFKAQRMTLAGKNEKIKQKGVCFACLRSGHLSRKCKAPVKCPVCQRRHPTLLCPNLSAQNPPNNLTILQATLNCTSEVILNTLMIVIRDPISHRKKAVRVLLDSGSQKSYILRKTAKELKLSPSCRQSMNHVLFGGCEMKNELHSIYKVELWDIKERISFQMTMVDQGQICGQIPRYLPGSWMTRFVEMGVCLNDSIPHKPLEVKMLIGADYLGQLLTGRIVKLDNGLTATETALGWMVMGQIDSAATDSSLAMTVISMNVSSASITELWRLDSIGIRDPVETRSKEDKEKLAQ